MAIHGTITNFRKAAQFRLQDARELMESPSYDSQRSDASSRHLRGAMYLAGYAVECLLKAYLIQMTSTQTLDQAQEQLIMREKRNRNLKPVENIAHSAAGHKLMYLFHLSDLRTHSGYDGQLMTRVSKWR